MGKTIDPKIMQSHLDGAVAAVHPAKLVLPAAVYAHLKAAGCNMDGCEMVASARRRGITARYEKAEARKLERAMIKTLPGAGVSYAGKKQDSYTKRYEDAEARRVRVLKALKKFGPVSIPGLAKRLGDISGRQLGGMLHKLKEDGRAAKVREAKGKLPSLWVAAEGIDRGSK